MLNEEVAKYRELSGDTNPNTPISRIGGYLDGYEKALEQSSYNSIKTELNGDTISRQAVLDITWEDPSYTDPLNVLTEVRDKVKDLPPVTPQPKTGHWEWVQYDYNPKLGNWHCSECRSVVIECVDKNDKGGIPLYKYCPQCGAKMVEPQESEE